MVGKKLSNSASEILFQTSGLFSHKATALFVSGNAVIGEGWGRHKEIKESKEEKIPSLHKKETFKKTWLPFFVNLRSPVLNPRQLGLAIVGFCHFLSEREISEKAKFQNHDFSRRTSLK